MSVKEEIFMSDVHQPHTHAPSWNLALKVIEHIQPDLVHVGGDGMDLHSVSRHKKEPVDKLGLKDELARGRAAWKQLRRFAPNSLIEYKIGNHDTRIERLLIDRAEELYGLDELRLPALLRLDELGFKVIGEKQKHRHGRLWHFHGHEIPGGGGRVARSKFMETGVDMIFGHHHVFDHYYERDFEGVYRYSHANACLYTLEPEYAFHTKWHLGISRVRYFHKGFYQVEQIPFHRDGDTFFCMVDGRHFSSTGEETMAKRNLKLVAASGRA